KRLLQVVINLVGNAIKFTPQGEVILRASLVSKKQDQLMMRFEVEDTGIGIDKDYISLLFDEFSQLDNSKTRKYEGTGLGLSISKKIVDLLGGEIGVESRKGQGSKFWFTIATRETKGELVLNMPDKPKADFTPLGLKVLLVDDKIVNRKIAALILKKMGCETDTAVNGLEGVDKVIKNHYDVVLMDIQMPVMDGITAMKAIRNSVKKQPWIIGLSAEAMDGDAEKYMDQGMDDYIAKPIVGHVLYEKLGRVVKTVQ
ncbi:MAG: ATP-binding protein, partial [Bacteroidota bacterium]